MHRAGTMALLTLGLLGCGDAARDRASDAVTEMGGHVEYDDQDSGMVRRIIFDDKSRVGGGDLEFGAGLVAQAGVAFENSWYVRETLERKKIEQELELAATIQEQAFFDLDQPVLPVRVQ